MASSGVNVKMGVSGIAQFKQNITTAKNSLKTLDAQLALNEKQFKASGDAEAYMQEKSDLLKLKLEEQKAVISNTEKALKQMTENGVDKSSKSFQDMQQQLLKAKGELIDTETAMSGIGEVSSEAADDVSGMNQQLKRIGDGVNFENVTNGLGKITDSIQAVITKALRMGRVLITNTMGAAEWADDLMTRVEKWDGVSAKELQQMDKIADYAEADADTILGAQDKMVKGINSGNKTVMGIFADKHLDPTRLKQTREGIVTLFWEAGDSLMHMTDESKRDEAALALFGKSWRELMPLFSMGRKEYERLMSEQSVVDDKQIQSLLKMKDSVTGLTNEWETFQTTILATLAEGLQPLLETATDLMKQLNEYLQSEEGQAMLQSMADAIRELFSGLAKIDAKTVMEKLKGLFDKVTEGFQWVIDNKDKLLEALKVIAGGFGLLKLGGLALNVGKLVTGFKGLLGLGGSGEAAAAATGSVGTTLTGVASKSASFITGMGMFPGVVADMFLNQTNAGRSLRDGTDFFAGVQQDIQETVDTWKHNAETFDQDWQEVFEKNPIFQAFLRRDENADAATRLESGANWSRSDQGGVVYRNPAAVNPAVNQAPSYMGGAGPIVTKKEIESLNGIPAEVESATEAGIRSGFAGIKIYIDGQQAGAALSPYVANNMGGMVMRLMVPQ